MDTTNQVVLYVYRMRYAVRSDRLHLEETAPEVTAVCSV